MVEVTGRGQAVIVAFGEREQWGQVISLLEPHCRIGTYPLDASAITARHGVPLPLTYADVVKDMRSEMRLLREKERIFLMGQSIGGIFSQAYARNYPDEIAGLILVDSSHEDQLRYIREFDAELGKQAEAQAIQFFESWLRIIESQAWLRTTPPLPRTLSQLVISRGLRLEDDITFDVWQKMQENLATGTDRSTHIVAKGSGHRVQFDEPALVVEAVKQFLLEVAGAATP
jgi:pimeloyl-ACP methyl ester carboxylesterase